MLLHESADMAVSALQIAPASPTWTIRMSNNAVPAAVNPLYAMSSKGGKAGPVTLAARRLRRAI